MNRGVVEASLDGRERGGGKKRDGGTCTTESGSARVSPISLHAGDKMWMDEPLIYSDPSVISYLGGGGTSTEG